MIIYMFNQVYWKFLAVWPPNSRWSWHL